jgi:hypothetical protein
VSDRDQVITAPMRQWAKGAIARIGRKAQQLPQRRKRKAVVVHLDGVPFDLLQQAIARGEMPFFSRLVTSGAYQLDTAFWGSPASTPCFQAGLLYGERHPNLPAYHWYDRELSRVVRMNVPKDTCAIEARLNKNPRNALLEGGGTAYLSLFNGTADNQLCMTALNDLHAMGRSMLAHRRGLRGSARRSALTWLRHLAGDTWRTARDVMAWGRRLEDFRHEREYLMNRFFMISLGWELAHSRALVDMVRGVPAIYLVFGNYDEISHRRGPRSMQSQLELRRADRYLEELHAVARTLDEPYDVYFVSDHGHVDSSPIEPRIGRLEKVLFGKRRAPPLPDACFRALLDGRDYLPVSPVQELDEPLAIEAGNFAHVYLTRGKEPLEAMQLLQRHREVLARAVATREIGIVALRRGDSAVAVVNGQVYRPDEIASAPLASGFSRAAVADLLRELPHMKSAGDLVLFGDAFERGSTWGFAWEFGSHGGLTRIETDSIVCWPSDAPVDLRGLTHAVQLHDRLSEVYRQ